MALPLATLQSAGDTATDNGQDYIVALVGGTKVWRLNTPSVLSFLNGDGTIIGATSQAQDFTNGLTIAGGSNGLSASGALTAASAKLTGAASQTIWVQSATPTLFLLNTGNTADKQFQIRNHADKLRIQAQNDAGTSAVDRVAITHGGLLGLNTVSPAAQLHVVNGSAAQPALRIDAAAGQAAARFVLYNASSQLDYEMIADGRIKHGVNAPQIDARHSMIGNAFAIAHANNYTNNANKESRYGVLHYTNSEEPAALLYGTSVATDNYVTIGGGSSVMNAATIVRIYAASTATTTTGTEIARFDADSTAGNTRFSVYDVDTATLARVEANGGLLTLGNYANAPQVDGSGNMTLTGALTAAGATVNGSQTLYKATNDTMLKIETAGNNRTFSVWSATNGGYISAWNGAGTENARLDGRASSSSWVLNKLGINTSSPAAQLHTVASSATTVGLRVDAAAGQTANLTEWRDSTGTLGLSISVDGTAISGNTTTGSARFYANTLTTNGPYIQMYGDSHAKTPGEIVIIAGQGATGANETHKLMHYNGSSYITKLGVYADGYLYVRDATAPGSNPSSGGYLYVESGALKYRGSSGSITTIANA